MTPAEQGQENLKESMNADVQVWTIKGCSVCGFESLVRKTPQGSALDHAVHEKKNPGEFEVEVVPAQELEMCQRYFPFMRRSRDEAVKREKATREWANQRTREEADHADRQTKKLQEAQEREKALREALENALAADTESETRHIIYAALDQSETPPAREELRRADENRLALWQGEHDQRNRAIKAEADLKAAREEVARLRGALERISTFPIDVTNAGYRTLDDLKALRLVAYAALDQSGKP